MISKMIKKYLILSLLLFVLGFGFFVFLYIKISKNEEISRQKQLELQIEESKKNELESLSKLIASSETEIKQLEESFVKESDTVEFINYIESLATLSGLEKAEVSSLVTSLEDKTLLLDINATGSFETLYKLLLLFESARYEIQVVSLDLQKVGNSTDNTSFTSWKGVFKIKLLNFIPDNNEKQP